MKHPLYPAAAFLVAGLLVSASAFSQQAPDPPPESSAAPAESKEALDPQRVLELLGAAAEKGDDAVIFQIGKAYLDAGQPAEAEKWLKRAAENGYVAAQMELARLYFLTAKGDPEKEKLAAEWVRKAAASGDVNAQMALSLLYEKGLGVAQDSKQAAVVFEKLAKIGHPGAQYNLGIMYRDGVGVEKSAAKAASWLSLAVQGYKEGPVRDRIVAELKEIKEGMSSAELSESKSLYERTVMFFQGGGGRGGESGDISRPELPSAQAVQPKQKEPGKEYDISGFVQAGWRWQDNAAGAPPVSAGGARPRPDSNVFAMGSIGVVSPPKIGVIDNVDTRGVVYQTRQHNKDNSDLGFVEVSSGPNISLSRDGKYSARPYLTANAIQVDSELYQVSGGGGINLVGNILKNSAIVLSAEEVWINFKQSSIFTTNNQSDGTQIVVSARGLHRLVPWLTADLGLTWRNVEARSGWRSSENYRIANGYSVKLPPLISSWSPRPASLYGSVAYKRGLYDLPDPSVAPGIKRADNEWQATLTGEFPVAGDWSVVPTLQKTGRNANAKIYESTNTMGSLVAMYKF